MALVTKKSGNGFFLKINSKEGCVQHREKGEDGETLKDGEGKAVVIKHRPGMTSIVGVLRDVEIIENEYEGNKTQALRLRMDDIAEGEPTMFVDLPFSSDESGASFFGLQVMGKLNAGDITKPFSLTPWFMKEGHKSKGHEPLKKSKSGCVVTQTGADGVDVKLAPDFGNGLKELPELSEVMIGKKAVKNKDEWDKISVALFDIIWTKLHPDEKKVETPALAKQEAKKPSKK